jgi:hypothetical protein
VELARFKRSVSILQLSSVSTPALFSVAGAGLEALA